MIITIAEIPPSLNKYLGNSHNFNLYRKEKERWQWLVREQLKGGQVPIAKAVVTIKYYFPTKARHDPDNYSGKFLLDALVRNNVLKDDSFNNVTLILQGHYDKNNPRTEIIVEGV